MQYRGPNPNHPKTASKCIVINVSYSSRDVFKVKVYISMILACLGFDRWLSSTASDIKDSSRY